MRILIDRFIELLKWPIALYMLASLPAFVKSLYAFNFMSWKYVVLAAGIVMFFISKNMSDAGVKNTIQIIAHEFTHAFFAYLTFHKVTHISIEGDNSGGHMEFKGKGNWLIIIGPYFFPLFCLLLAIVLSLLFIFLYLLDFIFKQFQNTYTNIFFRCIVNIKFLN